MIAGVYAIDGGKIMKKATIDDFIEKANQVHNNKYDYSNVDYVNSITPVTIICPEHGAFQQRPDVHLQGHGCPACKKLKKLDTAEFIKRAKETHGDRYDYSKSIYKNKRTKLIITCPIHGDFEQLPMNHIRGQGCPICGKQEAADRNGDYKNARKTKEEFQKFLNERYNGKYEIIGDYVNNKTHTEFYCHASNKEGNEHGIFITRPDGLVNGHGCPKCGHLVSKPESEVFEFIKANYNGKVISRDRTVLNGKELDIYLPELQLAIEFNGLIWHSEKFCDKHEILGKLNTCNKRGIRLINIFEDEWMERRPICESKLKNLLGQSTRIYARKCEIREVDASEAKNFLEENHLQGYIHAQYNIGLFYEEELVSMMSFGPLRKNLGSVPMVNKYELYRFCNKLNLNIVGGASKLFQYFIKQYEPSEIISYADRRWSDGNLYRKLNFAEESITPQNYSYLTKNGSKRVNRFSMRKDILVKKYGCPEGMTEAEFCKENKYYRIYDCGSYKFVWKKEI